MPKSRTAENLYKVFMVSPDGSANRTIELMAASPDKARKAAERQAYDVATNLGQNPDGEDDAYEVQKVEKIG
jgi:hypothetical protein